MCKSLSFTNTVPVTVIDVLSSFEVSGSAPLRHTPCAYERGWTTNVPEYRQLRSIHDDYARAD